MRVAFWRREDAWKRAGVGNLFRLCCCLFPAGRRTPARGRDPRRGRWAHSGCGRWSRAQGSRSSASLCGRVVLSCRSAGRAGEGRLEARGVHDLAAVEEGPMGVSPGGCMKVPDPFVRSERNGSICSDLCTQKVPDPGPPLSFITRVTRNCDCLVKAAEPCLPDLGVVAATAEQRVETGPGDAPVRQKDFPTAILEKQQWLHVWPKATLMDSEPEKDDRAMRMGENDVPEAATAMGRAICEIPAHGKEGAVVAKHAFVFGLFGLDLAGSVVPAQQSRPACRTARPRSLRCLR